MDRGLALCHGATYRPIEEALKKNHYPELPLYEAPKNVVWDTLDIKKKVEPTYNTSMWHAPNNKYKYIISVACSFGSKAKAVATPIFYADYLRTDGSEFFLMYGLGHFIDYRYGTLRKFSEDYDNFTAGLYPQVEQDITMLKSLGNYREALLYSNGILFKK